MEKEATQWRPGAPADCVRGLCGVRLCSIGGLAAKSWPLAVDWRLIDKDRAISGASGPAARSQRDCVRRVHCNRVQCSSVQSAQCRVQSAHCTLLLADGAVRALLHSSANCALLIGWRAANVRQTTRARLRQTEVGRQVAASVCSSWLARPVGPTGPVSSGPHTAERSKSSTGGWTQLDDYESWRATTGPPRLIADEPEESTKRGGPRAGASKGPAGSWSAAD